MKLPNISIHASGLTLSLSKGFTLIEILIVVAIISFLAVLGVVAGVDTYQRYIFRSDLDKVASLLQKARSSAMNNVYEEEHGVKLDDEDNLILFRGALGPFDYRVEKSKAVIYSDTCPGHQVVFAQLTGSTAYCDITLTEGNKVNTITINTQGGINY